MGIRYNTSIVRDGLVLHLDAANKKSYPGTGTVWKDLSGNGNNGTLVNGVEYSSDNKGAMVFDGVNDYVDTGSSDFLGPSLSGLTVSCWIRIKTRKTAIIAENGTSFTTNTFYIAQESTTVLSFLVCNDGSTAVQRADISDYELDTWINFVGVWSSNSVISSYINGTFATTSILNPSNIFSNLKSGNTNLWIGRRPGGALVFDGDISNVQIYDRALPSQEIQQNFEALRGRYGI